MKRLLAFCSACGAALLADGASAQISTGVASGIGVGVASTVATEPGAATRRLPGAEPPDWVDPQTGTTTALGRGCGVVTQVTLTVTPSSAYLNVLATSTTRETIRFDGSASLVDFSGRARRRVPTKIEGDLAVEVGFQHWLSLELPSKSDLRDQTYLDVSIVVISRSFGKCRVTTRLLRPEGPRRVATDTAYSVAEISFGLGARLLTTGDLHELAPKPGLSFGFDFTFFTSLNHGLTLDIARENPGRTKALEVDPGRTFTGTPSIEAGGFFLGYVARLPLAPWLSVSYSPQFGVVPFQLLDDEQGAEATSAVFCPRQRLRAVLPFVRLSDSHFFAGVNLAHTYVPYGNLGEVPLSGNLLSGQVLLGYGG